VKFPRYSEYKPSSIDWFGEIPIHWKEAPLRRFASRYSGGTPDKSNDSYWENGTIPWLNSGAVNQGAITEPSTFITAEAYANSSAKWVRKGALVMALAGQGKTKGLVAQTLIDTTCNQSMAAINPAPGTNPRYLFWLLTSQYSHIRNMAGGEQRDGLNLDIVGSIPCLKVPPDEQNAIATFLDSEVRQIEILLDKKRVLIERLKEKRSALISRTVTRGLPADAARPVGLSENAPLKETGIVWLGQVPEHWEVKQLKWTIMFQRGHDLPTDEREDGKFPLITSAGLSTHVSAAKAKAPGIVTGRYGTIGAFYLIEEDYWPLNTTLYSIDLRGNHPKYLLYMLNHLAPLFLVNAAKSAVPGVDRNDIHPTPTAVPPLPEQVAIAEFLDREIAQLDNLSVQVEKAIDRLQEYRAALINAAVTGKIDVRKAIA
jgi:type I restriction enzyme, S subunit